ncbi:hypothetical protein VPH35_039783 [Triticum aestivum]
MGGHPRAAAANPVILLLLLLLVQGRGGHDAITIATLDMDADMGVEAAQMGAEPAAHRRLLWATGGGRRYIRVPYYNCRTSTTANPYTRGCESITRCRDDDPS